MSHEIQNHNGTLEALFSRLHKANEKAFIPFLTVGDPNPEQFLRIVEKIAPHADIVELGIPFSDPMADGPVIQRANFRAMQSGVKRTNSFDLIKKVKEISKKPIVLLTYANVLGLEPQRREILKKFAESGVNGIIAADVPIEESEPILKDAAEFGINIIFLATPTTKATRLDKILSVAKGFVYVVSVKGVTGARDSILEETKETIQRILKFRGENQKIAICIGFGISTPDHVSQIVNMGADGVIVGSAIIQRIENNLNDSQKMIFEIEEFVKQMKGATLAK
jgi:tryptophan synthase alpha chain